eukprot:c7993_g1_i2.p1 GENE.c7993_g1_i2~~c7993_g1_i2.p1  ORF type:complete len:121 (+),score=21.37 c7993_g1_i2:287-649(+)
MSKIEEALYSLHASTRQSQSDQSTPTSVSPAVHTTFSFVHTIENDSPAYKAGLRVHDEIISFGHISSAKHFQDIASLVKDKEGQSIPVKVLREGQVINLSLTPARWQGKGLLGCHILVNQ